MRERVVQRVVTGDNFDPDAFENLWCEGGSGTVSGGADDLQWAGHFEIPHEIVDIGLFHSLNKLIRSAIALTFAIEDDVTQLPISSGPCVRGRSKPIFTPVSHLG